MEVRKSTVEMAQLDSVLTRVWRFIHPEHNFIILSLQNVIMSHMCMFVSLQSPAHRWALWTAAHFIPSTKLPQLPSTKWWHLLKMTHAEAVFSNHQPRAQLWKHREMEQITQPQKSVGLMPLWSEPGFHLHHMEFLSAALDVSSDAEIITSMSFRAYYSDYKPQTHFSKESHSIHPMTWSVCSIPK